MGTSIVENLKAWFTAKARIDGGPEQLVNYMPREQEITLWFGEGEPVKGHSVVLELPEGNLHLRFREFGSDGSVWDVVSASEPLS